MVGTVERVVYESEDTRYLVMRLLVPGEETLVTVVGRGRPPEVGAKVTMTGAWDVHPTHGRQFRFGTMEVAIPTTPAGIVRRLMRYPGIKEVIANRIVARFGLDTLAVLEEDPRRLKEVEGIGAKSVERITEYHQTTVGPVGKLEAQLLELELPAYLAGAIHDRYGDKAMSTLREQPYRLARDVRGIGFATADRIARAHGLRMDSPDRIDAGVLYVIERAEADGHCAVPIEALVERAAQSLSVDEGLVRDAGERLVRSGDLVLERGEGGVALCFPHRFVLAESAIAEVLRELCQAPRKPWRIPPLPDGLSAGQVQAVHAVAEAGALVLTGGPGTGKSTVVRQILELADENGVDAVLCAPTGRAAKRLEQTTGHKASTIHRLLEVQADTGRFAKGPHDPLPKGLVVVDEASMLDVALADALLSALTPEHRLLLVGDADQLPSVGPGNVLRDVMAAALLSDGALPLVRLTEVFRQAEGSSIVHNAHRILAGERPEADEAGSGGEFFVVHARDAARVHELVVKIASERIPEAYGLDARLDVQVLVPMHKGRAGTEAFNASLQDLHTVGKPEVTWEAQGRVLRRFRPGDRVMQTKNDYDKGVYNGDVGLVTSVDPEERQCVIEVDGESIKYTGRELMALTLAYAVTIHKSQGSEFEAVVVPLLSEHHVMLRNNLLYTAVTRAKRLCVVVGDPRAIDRAVKMRDAARRHTGLRRRVAAALGVVTLQADAEAGGEAGGAGMRTGWAAGAPPKTAAGEVVPPWEIDPQTGERDVLPAAPPISEGAGDELETASKGDGETDPLSGPVW